MRIPHVLKGNLRSEEWRYCVFVDTETSMEKQENGSFVHHFRLGQACFVRRDRNTEEWLAFDHPDTFWQTLSRWAPHKQSVKVFAHNLYFDFKILQGHVWLPRHQWSLKHLYFARSGPQCFLQYKRGKKSLLFVNTLNYFHTSLRTLGEHCGIPKGKVDFQTVSQEDLFRYCRRDVEILKTVMLEYLVWLKAEDLGNPKKTLASQAFTTYRHRFMSEPIHIHTDTRAIALERAAYHGGRVDVFFKGSALGQFYELDVNSMYPFVMLTKSYPCKLLVVKRYPEDLTGLEREMQSHYCIAHCDISTDEEVYPTYHERMLCHPTGHLRTTLCHEALKYALKHHHLKKVWTYAVYQSKKLFEGFVNYFWGKRQEAQENNNTLYNLFYKEIMASLSGKFGQHGQIQVVKPCKDKSAFDSTLVSVDEVPMHRWRFSGKEVWFFPKQCPEGVCVMEKTCSHNQCKLREGSEGYDSFPAISAAICDYARMYLWALIQAAGPGTVYYCDTDALIVSEAGYEALQEHMGDGLGQLKLKRVANELTIYGPKDYTLGTEEIRKGIRLNAIPLEGGVSFQQEQWEHIRSGLRNSEPEGIEVKTTVKQLHRQLKTRTPGPEGWTRALSVKEW